MGSPKILNSKVPENENKDRSFSPLFYVLCPLNTVGKYLELVTPCSECLEVDRKGVISSSIFERVWIQGRAASALKRF